MNTRTASNKTESVEVVMDGAGEGFHKEGGTVVRKTTDGRFAVMVNRPGRDGAHRLIKVFAEQLHARRYNYAIHGDRLGI